MWRRRAAKRAETMKKVRDRTTARHRGFRIRGFVLALWAALAVPCTLALDASGVSGSSPAWGSPVLSEEEAHWVAQAETGSGRDKMMLGLRYLMGRGVPADDAQALRWFRAAAQEGDAVAQVSLATMMAFDSDTQDVQGAAIWFGRAAAQGNTQAQAELARMLESGNGMLYHPEEAEQWRRQAGEQADTVMRDWAWKIAATGCERWAVPPAPEGTGELQARGIRTLYYGEVTLPVATVEAAAGQGDPVAQTVMGLLLATGNGVPLDEARALGWFKTAAQAGHAPAQAVLGELYMLGWGPLAVDQAEAASWMRKAAEQGLREAQTSYGSMLAGGKGVKKDKKEAFRWIRQAAQANEARAQLMMAMNALARDKREEAAQWFYQAAENGDDEVLSMLGVLYGWGHAAVAGESEKLTEVRRYAQRGEPEAQLMLGLLYAEGWGTPRDAQRAERWFHAAASQNYPDIWLPLGLFYAETDRPGLAREAFDMAVKQQAFSFARDRGILQLIFIESEKMPELDETLLSGRKAVFSDGVGDGSFVPAPPALDESRPARIARKIAFLREMMALGNPAAEMMMAALLAGGWSVPQDEEMAARLRALAHDKMCTARGETEGDCPEEDEEDPDGTGESDEMDSPEEDDQQADLVRDEGRHGAVWLRGGRLYVAREADGGRMPV